MSAWASLMLIAGGLFAGGAATFAWSRVTIWRRMPVQEFVGDFEETLRRLERRIVATPPAEAKAIYEMRARWFRGHLGRSMLATASFVAVAVAATL